ncbi:hypothetical protein D3C80_1252450 [compost metagenome]
MGHRGAAGGIYDVGVTLAIQLVVVAIAAGGAQRHAVRDHHVLDGAGPIRGFDDGHPPGVALGVVALAAHGPRHFDEVVAYPLALQQRRELVRGRPFSQGGEIQIEIGDGFAEQEFAILGRQAQLVDADSVAGLGDLLRRRPLDRALVRPEAPQVDQRPHGHIQLAAGELARVYPLLHYLGHAGRYDHGLPGRPLIEAGDDRARIIGGDLLIHAHQQGIDLAL